MNKSSTLILSYKDKTWSLSESAFIGREKNLKLFLDDNSVSRKHAEIFLTKTGWQVRDQGSTNGTFINGKKLSKESIPLQPNDIVQFGEIALRVEAIHELPLTKTMEEDATDDFNIESVYSSKWDEALQSLGVLGDRTPKAGEKIFALLRAGHYLANIEKQEELLKNILTDTVAVLDAQRGAIALLSPTTNNLVLKAVETGFESKSNAKPTNLRVPYSDTIAQRCMAKGESILYKNPDDLKNLGGPTGSISEGVMGSILCVLLRTPRKKLGILHLDRGPLQPSFTKDDLKLADALAAHVSSGIECAMLLDKQRNLFLNTVTILAQAVELRDIYTGGHTNRVTAIAMLLANEAKMSEEELEKIRTGTPLHDIGKIGIDDAILRKPSKLTPEESEIMKQHTTKGAAIVMLVPDLVEIIPIVRSHHERWDGNGYPDGLKGEKIPRIARVVAIADAMDAMVSDRPYRKGLSLEKAFDEIGKGKYTQFDPDLVDVFIGMRKLLDNYPEIPII
ncbi:MAG: HD domain-containing protein [Planctomycetes bacterium]|nr:HD domain-containing protein [Planctomycetota bacterium]NBY01551.1 HD domain-containing protein [Planctomycetota bacterium]